MEELLDVGYGDYITSHTGDGSFLLAGSRPIAYVSRDPAPWGANEVWERADLDDGGYSWNEFLLCYDSRVVEIQFDWMPTAEQMEIVGEEMGRWTDERRGQALCLTASFSLQIL